MNVSFETLIVSGVECNRSNETQASALGSNIELNQLHGCTRVYALFLQKNEPSPIHLDPKSGPNKTHG